jgi:hypothetical protein
LNFVPFRFYQVLLPVRCSSWRNLIFDRLTPVTVYRIRADLQFVPVSWPPNVTFAAGSTVATF